MALFGAPLSSEDHAERAVLATTLNEEEPEMTAHSRSVNDLGALIDRFADEESAMFGDMGMRFSLEQAQSEPARLS